MKIPKEKIKIKIKTESAVIVGNVHIMNDARLSDYFSSQFDKFIPVTEAVIFPINCKIEDVNGSENKEIVFVNIAKIEFVEYL